MKVIIQYNKHSCVYHIPLLVVYIRKPLKNKTNNKWQMTVTFKKILSYKQKETNSHLPKRNRLFQQLLAALVTWKKHKAIRWFFLTLFFMTVLPSCCPPPLPSPAFAEAAPAVLARQRHDEARWCAMRSSRQPFFFFVKGEDSFCIPSSCVENELWVI